MDIFFEKWPKTEMLQVVAAKRLVSKCVDAVAGEGARPAARRGSLRGAIRALVVGQQLTHRSSGEDPIPCELPPFPSAFESQRCSSFCCNARDSRRLSRCDNRDSRRNGKDLPRAMMLPHPSQRGLWLSKPSKFNEADTLKTACSLSSAREKSRPRRGPRDSFLDDCAEESRLLPTYFLFTPYVSS